MKNFAKRISALVLAVVVSAAVLCPAAFAAQLPSLPKDQCVVDDAGVLSSSTVQTITELNAQLESSCSGAQIGVLTVEYTGNDSTEDYAVQAANAWGIGSSTGKNGVLILLVMETQQYADKVMRNMGGNVADYDSGAAARRAGAGKPDPVDVRSTVEVTLRDPQGRPIAPSAIASGRRVPVPEGHEG